MSYTASTAAIFCLLALYLVLWVADALMTILNAGEKPSTWELVAAYPFLSLGLVISATLLALFRMLMREAATNRALVWSYVEGAGNPQALATGTSIIGGVSELWGWCIMVYMVLYPLHLGWRISLN